MRVGIRKRKEQKEREKPSRERGKMKKKAKILRIILLDHNSSVEVGYGFYNIRS